MEELCRTKPDLQRPQLADSDKQADNCQADRMGRSLLGPSQNVSWVLWTNTFDGLASGCKT